ncbi:hypothetical protein ES703_72357 [subsurface metagenome]
MVGEIVDKVVNQAHMVVDINPGKFYPVTDEDLVVREANAKV